MITPKLCCTTSIHLPLRCYRFLSRAATTFSSAYLQHYRECDRFTVISRSSLRYHHHRHQRRNSHTVTTIRHLADTISRMEGIVTGDAKIDSNSNAALAATAELKPKISQNARSKMHHDTHALPPQFVQDMYWRYISGKKVDLDNDPLVIDFRKGLSDGQKEVMRPVGRISATTVRRACERFREDILKGLGRDTKGVVALGKKMSRKQAKALEEFEYRDVVVYEHEHFPGLQVTPGILPPEAQILYLSKIMHECLANPLHKTNLQAEYDLEYPDLKPDREASQSEGNCSRTSVRPSLFTYRPVNVHATPKDSNTHRPLSMSQYLSAKLRWLTIGEQYDWPTRSYSGKDETPFPSEIANLVSDLFPHIRAESGVCLLYGSKGYMPVHRDVSEQCERALASFSFGCDGIFLVARGEEDTDDIEERQRRTVAIRVHSGDCVHMDGETRWAWHAMPRTITGTCPDYLAEWPSGTIGASEEEEKTYSSWRNFMASKRLNVSCRQVWD